jgi:hypothetical protein
MPENLAALPSLEANGETIPLAIESLCGSLAGFLYNPRAESPEAK